MARKKPEDVSPPGRPAGDRAPGYKMPPVSGQIKPGEVRNPYGRTGKPKEKRDALEMALSQRATIAGEEGTAEQVMYLQQVAMATKGNTGAFNALMKVMASRAAAGPAPPTPQQLAEEAADLAKRNELAATLAGTLDYMVQLKRDGVIEMAEGKVSLAQWVYDAMSMLRESLGEPAVPGKDGRWRPMTCTDAIVLPRPLDQPVE